MYLTRHVQGNIKIEARSPPICANIKRTEKSAYKHDTKGIKSLLSLSDRVTLADMTYFYGVTLATDFPFCGACINNVRQSV